MFLFCYCVSVYLSFFFLQQPNFKQKFVALLKRFKVTDEVRKQTKQKGDPTRIEGLPTGWRGRCAVVPVIGSSSGAVRPSVCQQRNISVIKLGQAGGTHPFIDSLNSASPHCF